MKKNKPIKAFYVGKEFPDYYGKPIEVRDDYSTKFPCYEIRFEGESRWHDNMDDEDWQVEKPDLEEAVWLKSVQEGYDRLDDQLSQEPAFHH